MNERKELNKLVVMFIRASSFKPTAIELYDNLRREHHSIMREEGVTGFKGFVKIVSGFQNIKPLGKRGEPMVYSLIR